MKNMKLFLLGMLVITSSLHTHQESPDQPYYRTLFSRICHGAHHATVAGLSVFFNWDAIQSYRERSELVEKMEDVSGPVADFIQAELKKVDIDPESMRIKRNPYFCFDSLPGSNYTCHGDALLINNLHRIAHLLQKQESGTLSAKDQEKLNQHRVQIRREGIAIAGGNSSKLLHARLAIPWVVQAACSFLYHKLLVVPSFASIGSHFDHNALTFGIKELGKTYALTAGELAIMILLLRSYTQHRKYAIESKLRCYPLMLDESEEDERSF